MVNDDPMLVIFLYLVYALHCLHSRFSPNLKLPQSFMTIL